MADGASMRGVTLRDLSLSSRWVAWRTEPRKAGEAATKVPYSTHGMKAASNRPEEWATREEAATAFQRIGTTPHGPGGIGVMLGAGAGDGFALGGIDLDTCRDPITDWIEPWAEEIRQALGSYAEVSPSGKGMKVFFRYDPADLATFQHAMGGNRGGKKWAWDGGDHPPGIELYLDGRFFTVTGDRLPDAPDALRLVPAETLLWLIREAGPLFKAADPAGKAATSAAAPELPMQADADADPEADTPLHRLHRLMRFRPTLRQRWEGDRTGLADGSRSTLAFALGAALRREGFNYEGMVALLRQNPHTASWVADKGDANAGRELRRIWDRGDATATAATTSAPAAIEWPAPIDFLGDDAMTGAPELKAEHVPEAIAGFAFDNAARMGVDPAAVALSCIVACAAVVTDDWRIQPKMLDDEWTENPRLWGLIVGDPSILKTPVINAATRPIDALEVAARERHAEAMRKWNADVIAAKADKANATIPPRPKCDRWMVEGTTIEALQEVLRDDDDAKHRTPARKVLLRQDELSGWLADMDRYSGGGKGGGDRAHYLKIYNGGRFTNDRVMRGSFAIPNWSACVLGGIQPEPIQRIAKEAADDGLLQRFLYCVPGAQGDGEDRAPDRDALARYKALVPALAALRPSLGSMGANLRPSAVAFHAEAHQHRIAIDQLVKAQAAMPDTSTRLKAALGKWRGMFARLALTFHLIDVADANAQGREAPFATVVPEATARRVASYIRDVLLPHLLRAEALLYLTPQTGHARWIAGHILASEELRAAGRVTYRDLNSAYGALRPTDKRRELEAVMLALEAFGWVRAELPTNPARPITTWHVNPALWTTFAARAAAERQTRDAARKATADLIRAKQAAA